MEVFHCLSLSGALHHSEVYFEVLSQHYSTMILYFLVGGKTLSIYGPLTGFLAAHTGFITLSCSPLTSICSLSLSLSAVHLSLEFSTWIDEINLTSLKPIFTDLPSPLHISPLRVTHSDFFPTKRLLWISACCHYHSQMFRSLSLFSILELVP